MSVGVLLIAHGTVESLDDLAPFLTNIRRGHPPSEELLHEVRRRYEAIGGKSPLIDYSRSLAKKVEARLGLPTRLAMRLWHPYPDAALREFAGQGITKVIVVPLAQHSVKIYADSVRQAAASVSEAIGVTLDIVAGENWGQSPDLTLAYATAIREALAHVSLRDRSDLTLFFTAHSLPKMIIDQGDPYEAEVRTSAEAVFGELHMPHLSHRVVFQSQGMSQGPGGRPMVWLGPDLRTALSELPKGSHVVVAPIGFLADHVEILYDLDIEAQAWAREFGITLSRSASLNDGDLLVTAIQGVVESLNGSSGQARS